MARIGKIFSVTVYRRAGFDMRYRPGSASALVGIPSKTLSQGFFSRTNRILSYIDMPTWEDDESFMAEDVTYCKISRANFGDMYYFVPAVAYINDGTVRFALALDEIGTLACNDKLISSLLCGEIQRCHVRDDATAWFNSPEPYIQSEPVSRTFYEINFNATASGTFDVIVSSVPLESLKIAALTFASEEGKFSAPAIPASTDSSTLIMGGTNTSVTLKMPKKTLYNADVYSSTAPEYNVVIDGQNFNVPQTIRGLGLPNLLTSAYSIPADFIPNKPTTMKISTLATEPVIKPTGINIQATFTPGQTNAPKNRKTLYFRRSVTLISESSMNSDRYESWELGDGNPDTTLRLVAVADPGPSGCVLAKPTYVKNSANSTNSAYASYCHRSVKSATWSALTVANEGGAVIPAMSQFAIAQKQVANQRDANAISSEATKAGLANNLAMAKLANAAANIGFAAEKGALATSAGMVTAATTLADTQYDLALEAYNNANTGVEIAANAQYDVLERAGNSAYRNVQRAEVVDGRYGRDMAATQISQVINGVTQFLSFAGQQATALNQIDVAHQTGAYKSGEELVADLDSLNMRTSTGTVQMAGSHVGGFMGSLFEMAGNLSGAQNGMAFLGDEAYARKRSLVEANADLDLIEKQWHTTGQQALNQKDVIASTYALAGAQHTYAKDTGALSQADITRRQGVVDQMASNANAQLAQTSAYNAQQVGFANRTYNNVNTALNIQGQTNLLAYKSSYLQAPEYISEAPVTLSAAMLTKYLLIVEDMHPRDRATADLFFCEYGYNVGSISQTDNPFSPQLFRNACYGRQNFNHVQMTWCHIASDYGSAFDAAAQASLIAGVTLWHVPPTPGKVYDDNPNAN